jgi:mevalonate kinase
MKIHASAPGKLILAGEHVSRYGKPSLVFAIDQRIHAFVEKRNDNKIILNSPEMNVEQEQWPSDKLNYVSVAIKKFLEKTGKKDAFTLTTKSEMIEGVGSSAASVIATLGALNEFFKTKLSKKQIMELGFEVIFEIQGFGSGIDIATAVYGGLIHFEKDKESHQVTDRQLPIIVGNTGLKVKSKPIVEAVQAKEKKYPDIFHAVIESIAKISMMEEDAIKKWDLRALGELMNLNHGLLYTEGVSSDILEKLVWAAKGAGAYGAKLSGAGVGDNMIALCPEDKINDVKKAIEKAGGTILPVKMDPKGLIVH